MQSAAGSRRGRECIFLSVAHAHVPLAHLAAGGGGARLELRAERLRVDGGGVHRGARAVRLGELAAQRRLRVEHLAGGGTVNSMRFV